MFVGQARVLSNVGTAFALHSHNGLSKEFFSPVILVFRSIGLRRAANERR